MENLHYIKDEMLVHVPICTHVDPKSVLVIGGCDNLYAEIKKHKTISNIVRLGVDEATDKIAELSKESFDIAIVATEVFGTDRFFWGLINQALSDRGIATTLSSSLLTQEEAVASELATAGELFKIVMPYRYESLAEDGHLVCKNLLLASHHYHPTADINLQRADLTEGYRYYNCDIAIGAFQLPTVARKRFLGLIKS
jgi:spermidine synthase